MRSRRLLAGSAATAAVLVTGALSSPVGAEADAATATPSGKATGYTVLVEDGASRAAAVEAVKAAGGSVLAHQQRGVGLLDRPRAEQGLRPRRQRVRRGPRRRAGADRSVAPAGRQGGA